MNPVLPSRALTSLSLVDVKRAVRSRLGTSSPTRCNGDTGCPLSAFEGVLEHLWAPLHRVEEILWRHFRLWCAVSSCLIHPNVVSKQHEEQGAWCHHYTHRTWGEQYANFVLEFSFEDDKRCLIVLLSLLHWLMLVLPSFILIMASHKYFLLACLKFTLSPCWTLLMSTIKCIAGVQCVSKLVHYTFICILCLYYSTLVQRHWGPRYNFVKISLEILHVLNAHQL